MPALLLKTYFVMDAWILQRLSLIRLRDLLHLNRFFVPYGMIFILQ